MKEIYKYLTDYELKTLSLEKYNKGEILYSENEECKNIGIIKKGRIKIASYLENGKEVIYNILQKGDIFGNNLLFSTNPIYRGDVIADEDCEVYVIDKKTLKSILKNNDQFLEEYLRIQSEFGKKLNLQIKILTFNNAKDRLMYYLEINNGRIEYKSVSKLAKGLFLTREVMSRTIHTLDKENRILLVDKKIIKI